MIFVVKGSRLVEQGTHDELVGSDGLYSQLHRQQTADMS